MATPKDTRSARRPARAAAQPATLTSIPGELGQRADLACTAAAELAHTASAILAIQNAEGGEDWSRVTATMLRRIHALGCIVISATSDEEDSASLRNRLNGGAA